MTPEPDKINFLSIKSSSQLRHTHTYLSDLLFKLVHSFWLVSIPAPATQRFNGQLCWIKQQTDSAPTASPALPSTRLESRCRVLSSIYQPFLCTRKAFVTKHSGDLGGILLSFIPVSKCRRGSLVVRAPDEHFDSIIAGSRVQSQYE